MWSSSSGGCATLCTWTVLTQIRGFLITHPKPVLFPLGWGVQAWPQQSTHFFDMWPMVWVINHYPFSLSHQPAGKQLGREGPGGPGGPWALQNQCLLEAKKTNGVLDALKRMGTGGKGRWSSLLLVPDEAACGALCPGVDFWRAV